MTMALATKPAQTMRGVTANVRDHLTAMQRAQDSYFAKLKRAEADYFEAVRRITDTLTTETTSDATTAGTSVKTPFTPVPVEG